MITTLIAGLEAHCLDLLANSNLVVAVYGEHTWTFHDNRWGSLIDKPTSGFVLVHDMERRGDAFLPGWEKVCSATFLQCNDLAAVKAFVQDKGIKVNFRGECLLHMHETPQGPSFNVSFK